ncbi:MAG: hypothetical protein CVU90_10340 [Firmicutes bacterium HGW-Firmicutes-15]|nr:MAG: hypothetical protein CVU90_10340 [Firmicutes bacterium HGW-Firmicutes-15]
MLKGKKSKLAALLVALFLMMAVVTPGAYALNSSTNKAFNYCGYNINSVNTIQIYLDKKVLTTGECPVKEQFKIDQVGGDTQVIDSISILTDGNYSGITSDNELKKGTTITIQLEDDLVEGEQYEVTANNTLYANNGSNIGSYFKKKNSEFICEYEPDSTNIVVTPRIDASDTGIPWESNIGFTIDRPVSTTTANNIISNMGLQKKDGNNVYQNVTLDPTLDTTAVSGAEAYSARKNDVCTYFFFPMTGNGQTIISYNLGSGEYRLVIPSFTDNGASYAGSNVDFVTTSGDVPGKLVDAPTVEQGTASDGQLNISWSTGTTSPVASEYNVYVSEDRYWDFIKKNSTPINTTSTTVTDLDNNKTYFVRITPVNNYGEGGFSLANASAVAP